MIWNKLNISAWDPQLTYEQNKDSCNLPEKNQPVIIYDTNKYYCGIIGCNMYDPDTLAIYETAKGTIQTLDLEKIYWSTFSLFKEE